MGKKTFALPFVLVGLLVAATPGVPVPDGGKGPAVNPMKVLEGMEAAYAGVGDYTATFLKRELVRGTLLPEENIQLKFKKPFKVYMKWLKGPHEGREALYVEGKYDNKVVGHDGGLIGFITLNMAPTGKTAMRGNRHPITDVGIGRLIGIVMENVRRAGREGALKLIYQGEEEVYGYKAYRISVAFPPEKGRGYYCRRLELWVDRGLGLPVKILIYGWKDEVMESYGYRDIKVNPGLPDSGFDKDNKEYGF